MPPLNAAIGASIASVSAIGIIPDRGLALMMVNPQPAATSRRTASAVGAVSFLSLSTSVPSTSDTSNRMGSISGAS